MIKVLIWTVLMSAMMKTRYSYEVLIREFHGMGTTPPHEYLFVDRRYSSTY
jgi:hypothetical protein